jgi:hypothetical protein
MSRKMKWAHVAHMGQRKSSGQKILQDHFNGLGVDGAVLKSILQKLATCALWKRECST